MPELVITTEQLDAALREVFDRWREESRKLNFKRDGLVASNILREELIRIFYSKLRLPIP